MTPLNCGVSAWTTTYNYDLAGDVTSWTHPYGYTITQTINGAREISQFTSSLNGSQQPPTLATVTYTPFGSVSTLQDGCVGTRAPTSRKPTLTITACSPHERAGHQ